MKVALAGAPGSGKTKLARALKRKLGDDWKVIDGYANRLAKKVGDPQLLDDGYLTSFPYELEVMTSRWIEEETAYNDILNTITCGTLTETLIYAASIQPWMQTEQQYLDDINFIQLMMTTLGELHRRAFDYNLVFFLPLEEPGHSWYTVVDAKIPQVLDGHGIPYVVLNGTHEQKVVDAFETIQSLINLHRVAEDEQQSV